jgi:hypothetical protein
MHAVVVPLPPELSDASTIAIENIRPPVLMMQGRERLLAESHAPQNVNRPAAIARVATGLPCLAERIPHDGWNITTAKRRRRERTVV